MKSNRGVMGMLRCMIAVLLVLATALGVGGAMTAAAGCAAPGPHEVIVPRTFVESSNWFANQTVGPEYERYVQSDATLTVDDKRARLENVAAYRSVVSSIMASAP